MDNIYTLRKEYKLRSLEIDALSPNPFLQFSKWFEEAQSAHVQEPNAMALATANQIGRPSCRMVLLKNVDERGFSFFTHYLSRKSRELDSNPYGCVTFYWCEVERQIIIEGLVEKLTEEESKNYFLSRPRGSQIGAWASQQDQPIASRKELEERYEKYSKMYLEDEVPLPPHWGGYCLIPNRFEFWQGRVNRLHDRFSYTLISNEWKIERLSP